MNIYNKYGEHTPDYFKELILSYGIQNIDLDEIGIWLINNGIKFSHKAVSENNICTAKLLISTDYNFKNKIGPNVFNLLKENLI